MENCAKIVYLSFNKYVYTCLTFSMNELRVPALSLPVLILGPLVFVMSYTCVVMNNNYYVKALQIKAAIKRSV